MYPYFYAGVYDYTKYTYTAYEVRPPKDKCNSGAAQSTTSGGLLVALCDASVRTVSPSVSYYTFYAATTPNSGDILGNDW